MRGGAGDYRSIGQVSGVWWSVFHFRSLAIFKIRRKKIARRRLSKTGLTFASKHSLYYSFWFHEKNVCKKKCLNLYHTLESKLLLSKKSLLIVYQLSDSHSVTKGARAPWLLIPQAEIEPAPPNLQKQFVYFTGMPGDEFFSRSGSTMEKAQVQFCRLEFDVDKTRVEGKCLLLELDVNKLWFDGKNVEFFISKNNFRFRAVKLFVFMDFLFTWNRLWPVINFLIVEYLGIFL